MKKPITILEWAEFYRSKGFNVIPLYDFSKGPTRVETWNKDFDWLPGWEPLQSRHATDKEFNHWFKESKPTGIALITGEISGVVAVDVDSYKAGGMSFHLNSKLRSKTANGGRHHFFKYSKDVKTSGFKQGVNIEIKSDGGIIVLPPSKVFKKDSKETGSYIWEETQKLDLLPTISTTDLAPYYNNNSDKRIVDDLHKYLNAPLGTQHNNLRTITNSILNRFPEKEWDIAVSFIREAASKFDPPHSPHRVDKMIQDCMNFIKSNPKTSPIKHGSQKSSIERRPSDQGDEKNKYISPKSLLDIKRERMDEKELEKIAPKTGYPDLDALIKGFIPGHLYTITGNTNVGKTSLACNFAIKIAEQKKSVLYFALEPENTVIDYLASVKSQKEFSDLIEEDYDFEGYDIQVYGKEEISEPDHMIRVVKETNKRYDLIIIDHIGYFIKDKANIYQDQSDVVKKLAGLAKQNQTAIIMIAHLRKRSSNQKANYVPTADDISGSGAFKQDSTEVIIVTRPPKDNNPETFELSPEGSIFVAKTKCGPNGKVPIFFSDRKAKIFSERELSESYRRKKSLSFNKYLTQVGFPDNKD